MVKATSTVSHALSSDAFMATMYRQPLDWSVEGIEQNKRVLDRLYSILHNSGYSPKEAAAQKAAIPEEISDALCDDLNTPKAIAALNAIAKSLADAKDPESKQKLTEQLLAAGGALGILQQDPAVWLGYGAGGEDAEIDALLAERAQARKDKNFARSDEIRDTLAAQGIEIEDTPTGAKWKRVG